MTGDLNTLIERYLEADAAVTDAMQRRWLIQREITETMERSRAREFEGPAGKATVSAVYEYDTGRLVPLREHLSAAEWERLWTQPKPPLPRIDKRQANKLMKRGGEILAILEAARIDGEPKLKITPKDGTS